MGACRAVVRAVLRAARGAVRTPLEPPLEVPLQGDERAMSDPGLGEFDLVVVANRLPVDRREEPDGSTSWQPSPGGLVAALEPTMHRHEGAWVGWTGAPDDTPEPFDAQNMRLVPVPLSAEDVELYYEGMSNGTLW